MLSGSQGSTDIAETHYENSPCSPMAVSRQGPKNHVLRVVDLIKGKKPDTRPVNYTWRTKRLSTLSIRGGQIRLERADTLLDTF